MKRTLCSLTSLIFGCLWQTAVCQQEAAPGESAKSPSVETTIAFMNGSLEQQGAFSAHFKDIMTTKYEAQSVRLLGQCSLEVTLRSKVVFNGDALNNYEGTRKTLLSMNQSDPLSVSLKPETLVTPVTYWLTIERAEVRFRPVETISAEVPPNLNGDFNVQGIVESIDQRALALVSDSGVKISFTLSPDVNVLYPSHPDGQGGFVSDKSDLADITPGDHVRVLRQSRGERSEGKWNLVFTDQIVLEKNSAVKKSFSVAVFADQELAGRVAKALIHAMVLCQEQKPASLF